jgi:S-adenosylmethionine:tRNA ribosyltransferase-isomerase
MGRAAKWKEKVISLKTKNFELNAEILERNGNTFTVKFKWQPEDFSFAEILEQAGEMPIPPYLKRQSEKLDLSRYQTVYAGQKGSVAAPTAGLHFTQQIFENLKSKNIITDFVTLHVSAGTFKPVTSETIEGHDMHSEWIEVNIASIEKILLQISDKQKNNNIVAVGTTSLRTIESLYWMGVKTNLNSDYSLPELEIKQWDAYELPQNIHTKDSLKSLLAWLKKNEMEKLLCKTQILIVPDYKLRIANALVTNFHQPCSTLLLLIAAVVGDDWKKIYKYALENNFRFLSYGDGSLIFKNNI